MLDRDDYDAILLDLKMPGGGAELIQKLEARNPQLLQKIIIVTGALDEAARVAGLPVHAIVRKPFEIDVLLATVQSCLLEAY